MVEWRKDDIDNIKNLQQQVNKINIFNKDCDSCSPQSREMGNRGKICDNCNKINILIENFMKTHTNILIVPLGKKPNELKIGYIN